MNLFPGSDRIVYCTDATRAETHHIPGRNDIMLGTLLTFFAVGLITLIIVGVVLSIVGTVFSLAFGLAGFLLFKVAPILLVGWLVLKLIDRRKPASELSAADREWLEGGR
jgi:hypothetical protein